MNKNRLSVLALFLAGLLLSGCQQEIKYETISDAKFIETQTPIVQADAASLIEATKSEDVEALLELSHSRVIDSLGGRADAYFAMEQVFQEIRNLKMSFDVYEIKGKPSFYRTERHEFAIQGIYSICTTPEVSIEQKSAVIGMRDLGSQKWKYMDYNTETEKRVYKIFPGLPKKLKLPKPTMDVEYL